MRVGQRIDGRFTRTCVRISTRSVVLSSFLLIFALNTAYNVDVYGVLYLCIDFDKMLLQCIRSFDMTINVLSTLHAYTMPGDVAKLRSSAIQSKSLFILFV